ncbi:hypothetical protein AUEXF2481DRAFT_2649 [Aureobasidium subglaciale EXF-2481]|uniref:Haloacid dehalogenase-like hydrolase n=1 Tax=Aureobasidium subglaciale (strain EXF-2481) TaxID=1043005 RepID=A0A074ZGN2_AURSE|nr:uncharacterized protein AUEXF2481DRAFT_2649 [Aureobasidium subglaciale EXF-2481]KEQ97716.1 hypothetical protein AUEXF2481DRAFT_2649 [Aureobasidium subglaciale EXF-2481]
MSGNTITKMRRPIHLIFDWDGTLTCKDSLSLVGSIAYYANSSKSLPPWSDFVTGYMDDYTEHATQYYPHSAARTTIDQERQWLASLAPIEDKSVRRVESSGVFKGVKASHVDHIAASAIQHDDLRLRSHWDSLFQIVLTDPINKISILSVNWSARFIRQSLLSASSQVTLEHRDTLSAYVENMQINANEISNLDLPGGSDGKLSKDSSTGIRTSADKLANMPTPCGRFLDTSSPERKPEDVDGEVVVYIGDSATDLEALLAADVGICIRDDPMGSSQRDLADTLTRIGVEINHIGGGVHKRTRGERVVYWTQDYGDVVKVISDL